jgi:hypothetical protein
LEDLKLDDTNIIPHNNNSQPNIPQVNDTQDFLAQLNDLKLDNNELNMYDEL